MELDSQCCKPVLVKICGLKRQPDAEAAIAAGADFLGFIFVPGTPRAIDTAEADWIRTLDATRVGVFRDATLATIIEIRDRFELDYIQLHGYESDRFIDALGPRVIRRVQPQEHFDWKLISGLSKRCLPLIDPGGGDGQSCDWRSLGRPQDNPRFGLAGGLNPDNVQEAINILHPHLVDVSSGIESQPGIKDHQQIRDFVSRAKESSIRFIDPNPM